MVRLPVYFPGPHSFVLTIPVVLVREWKGDALLSWRTLRKFGFNFQLDKKTFLPKKVIFHKYGVKIPLKEGDEEDILVARGIGKSVKNAITEKQLDALRDQVTCSRRIPRMKTRVLSPGKHA